MHTQEKINQNYQITILCLCLVRTGMLHAYSLDTILLAIFDQCIDWLELIGPVPVDCEWRVSISWYSLV